LERAVLFEDIQLLFIPIEFWKDRAILAVWMFFVCFIRFSNKVKIVHLRAGCFLKLDRDSRWKPSFIFITESNEPSKVLEFLFQIYINFSAVFCEQNFDILFGWQSKIFKFTMYFTNYFFGWKFGFVFCD
jgi:hypothetical protein